METQLYIFFVSFMDGDSGVYRCSGAGKLLGSYLVEGPLWWNDRVDMKVSCSNNNRHSKAS
jgi:hypothetical protein